VSIDPTVIEKAVVELVVLGLTLYVASGRKRAERIDRHLEATDATVQAHAVEIATLQERTDGTNKRLDEQAETLRDMDKKLDRLIERSS
jgi:hypothetical protein